MALTIKLGFTPPVPELAAGVHSTERFLARVAELIRHGDVLRADQFLRVPKKTLERWYYDWAERQRDTTPAAPITRIGIDELSLLRKFRIVITVVSLCVRG